jgi:cell division protein FtsB
MRSHFFTRVFLACYCSLACYCALSVLAGPAGLLAFRGLERRMTLMRSNIDSLSAENARLGAEFESLKSDPDRALREARALGYLDKGENALLFAGVDGREPTARSSPSRSEIVRMGATLPLADVVIKEIALLAGMLVFILGLAADLGQQPSLRHGRAGGLPRG